MPGVLGGRSGGDLLPRVAEHPQPRHVPRGAESGRRSGGCQTAARGTARRGKMSPSETIQLLNKSRCLRECSMFFSICLGSATLTSRPYRGAAEGMRLIVQETSALANGSALTKSGQEFNAFPLQKKSPLSFPPSLSATLNHHCPSAWPPLACLLLQKRLKCKFIPLKSWTGCSLPPRRLDAKHQKVPCGNPT